MKENPDITSDTIILYFVIENIKLEHYSIDHQLKELSNEEPSIIWLAHTCINKNPIFPCYPYQSQAVTVWHS